MRDEWFPVWGRIYDRREVGTDVFARVKTYAKDNDEVLYSQPFMLY